MRVSTSPRADRLEPASRVDAGKEPDALVWLELVTALDAGKLAIKPAVQITVAVGAGFQHEHQTPPVPARAGQWMMYCHRGAPGAPAASPKRRNARPECIPPRDRGGYV